MYKKIKANKTTLSRNESYIGESIEHKINRILNNKEPIKDGAPIIYTDRKDGVNPAHDIRTDRFEVAIDAMDVVSKTHKAKREDAISKRAKIGMDKEAENEKIKESGETPANTNDLPK